MIREHGRPTKAEKRSRKKKVNENLFVRQLDVTAAAVMSPKKTTIWYFFLPFLSSSGVSSSPSVVLRGVCWLVCRSLACFLALLLLMESRFSFSLLLRSAFVPFYFNPFRCIVDVEASRMRD
jgi:hypothetical protein